MTIRETSRKFNSILGEHFENAAEQRLSAQEVQRLSGVSSGDVILCTCGILWVTQEGDGQDYVLRDGEQFVAQRHGVVVVEAMTEAACLFSHN